MSEPKIKMYCIFSKEALKKMNGIRGKLASQAGHAYLTPSGMPTTVTSLLSRSTQQMHTEKAEHIKSPW